MAGSGGKKNWFAIWTSIAVVVVVLVVAGVVIIGNALASGPGTTPTASNVDSETGAISVGDGDATVATYVDFMCPICGNFEQVYGEQLDTLSSEGDITLDIHPVAILDRASNGTEFSTRAANAMYCVADASPDAVMPFMQTMFANQPGEGTDGMTDAELIAFADQAGAADITSCVEDRTFERFVGYVTKNMPANPADGTRGTPTVVIDGEFLPLSELTNTYFTDRFGQ